MTASLSGNTIEMKGEDGGERHHDKSSGIGRRNVFAARLHCWHKGEPEVKREQNNFCVRHAGSHTHGHTSSNHRDCKRRQ